MHNHQNGYCSCGEPYMKTGLEPEEPTIDDIFLEFFKHCREMEKELMLIDGYLIEAELELEEYLNEN
jgi:hypothetical protein